MILVSMYTSPVFIKLTISRINTIVYLHCKKKNVNDALCMKDDKNCSLDERS